MLAIDAGAAKLEDLGRKTELLFGVVTVMERGRAPRLHAVGANDAAAGNGFACIFDEQVFAACVESIAIEAVFIGALEAFAEFEVEDAEAQAASGVALLGSFSKRERVAADLRVQARYL